MVSQNWDEEQKQQFPSDFRLHIPFSVGPCSIANLRFFHSFFSIFYHCRSEYCRRWKLCDNRGFLEQFRLLQGPHRCARPTFSRFLINIHLQLDFWKLFDRNLKHTFYKQNSLMIWNESCNRRNCKSHRMQRHQNGWEKYAVVIYKTALKEV